MRSCSIAGCEGKYEAKGLCNKHYLRLRIHGDPLREAPSIRERFEAKVELIPFSACHWWAGATIPQGYGAVTIEGKTDVAHRVAYELYVGPIPEHDSYHGICVCHSCDNHLCVNPDHLFLGTHQDNMDDRDKKGRGIKGETQGGSKLKEAEVLEIRNLYKAKTHTYKALSEIFYVSKESIGDIIRRETWKHVA